MLILSSLRGEPIQKQCICNLPRCYALGDTRHGKCKYPYMGDNLPLSRVSILFYRVYVSSLRKFLSFGFAGDILDFLRRVCIASL
jgi:hypothetical protein